MPYAQRQELRAEIGAHAGALAEAYRELGSPPQEAVLRALQRMGDPRRVGRQWSAEWAREAGPVGVRAVFASLRVCLPAFWSAVVLTALISHLGMGHLFGSASNAVTLVGIPATVGLLAAAAGCRRPLVGACLAVALLAAGFRVAALPPWQVLWPRVVWVEGSWDLLRCWMPSGCLAAALGACARPGCAELGGAPQGPALGAMVSRADPGDGGRPRGQRWTRPGAA